jgi:hypothetical protein
VKRALIALVMAAGSAVADPPTATIDDAKAVLYGAEAAPTDCADVPCLIDRRYAADPLARAIAVEMFGKSGSLAGVGPTEVIDGGYRGKIKLVPQLPIKSYRQHLAWVAAAAASLDAFFVELFAKQPAPRYRWRNLSFLFVRSPGKHTPSAYTRGWSVEYNVDGSLVTSADSVRELVVHELFHSNDEDHGDWTAKHLATDYDSIVKRCGTKLACLAPFAPNVTVVRGGTYYAFQPNNGMPVHEYGAELAVRYFDEQTQMLRAGKLGKPAFKCGPPENGRAWKAEVDEFFGSRDLVPAC